MRCERPIDRVLYAIENGGFSGAYMPQNIVVGQDAIEVAKFVATYAGPPGAQDDRHHPLHEQADRNDPGAGGRHSAPRPPAHRDDGDHEHDCDDAGQDSASPAEDGRKTPSQAAKKKSAHP